MSAIFHSSKTKLNGWQVLKTENSVFRSPMYYIYQGILVLLHEDARAWPL